MQIFHEAVVVDRLGEVRQKTLDEIFDALLAARHLEQLVVQSNIPIPVQFAFSKGFIEREPVRVLGIGERAVNVEYDCFNGHVVWLIHKVKNNSPQRHRDTEKIKNENPVRYGESLLPFLCVSVSLIKPLAIRLRLATAPAKSLVMW